MACHWLQIAPSYNSEWGFEDGAQNDIFVPASESSSATSTSESSNDAPVQAVQNRVVVVDAASSQTKTVPIDEINKSANGGGKGVVTQTVVATRVHYATVTAQAANLKIKQQTKKKIKRSLGSDSESMLDAPQLAKRRMTHVRRASPHRLQLRERLQAMTLPLQNITFSILPGAFVQLFCNTQSIPHPCSSKLQKLKSSSFSIMQLFFFLDKERKERAFRPPPLHSYKLYFVLSVIISKHFSPSIFIGFQRQGVKVHHQYLIFGFFCDSGWSSLFGSARVYLQKLMSQPHLLLIFGFISIIIPF